MKIEQSRISTKGQLTIPKEFREKLNIHKGDEVVIYLKDEGIMIKPKVTHLGMLRGLFREEIKLIEADKFIQKERKKWRI
ncbi:MAG: AbrB/MazE/SpoVT family DNA-binding domain-containing protein [Candidatus Lokiarchaeota archaeon]|nr:AbrB/MazE/SpoVT family DNA-binding domain-containing protein [Candidatus Lokiarchaeota archaeon]